VASLRGTKPRRRRETDKPAAGPYSPVRGGVPKGPESLPWDQKPGDLGGGRVKPGETPVEARKGSDVQFVPLTPV
jgi:hypothetical protein